jgi:rRNA processing protein Gar1
MSEKTVLGKALHESKGSKNLIITLQADTRIGQPVTDNNGKMIGKVFDIFGPVETPYASIRLNDGVELGKIENKPVFLGRAPEKKKRRKKGRSH